MSDLSLEVLDLSDDSEIIKYERSLYRAFAATDIKTLDHIWDSDRSQKRLRTRIPYASQQIYLAKLHDAIISAAAINFNMVDELQLEMIGFTIDKTEPHICEGLCIFNLNMFISDKSIGAKHRDFVFKQLAQKGIKKMFGTCSERRRVGYELVGFELVNQRVFKGEKKYLIVMPVKDRSSYDKI